MSISLMVLEGVKKYFGGDLWRWVNRNLDAFSVITCCDSEIEKNKFCFKLNSSIEVITSIYWLASCEHCKTMYYEELPEGMVSVTIT